MSFQRMPPLLHTLQDLTHLLGFLLSSIVAARGPRPDVAYDDEDPVKREQRRAREEEQNLLLSRLQV